MNENAFSEENLKYEIFQEEYKNFPKGWYPLRGEIFNYCSNVAFNNPISSERIENFSASYLSGDFRFFIEKFDNKSNPIKNFARWPIRKFKFFFILS